MSNFCNLIDQALLAPLSKGFPRQEYWMGSHFLLQGIFPTQGLNPSFLHWQVGSLPLNHQGNSIFFFNPTVTLRVRHIIISFYKGREGIWVVKEMGPNHWINELSFELRSVFRAQNHYTITFCSQLLFAAIITFNSYPLNVKDFFSILSSSVQR